MELRAYYFGNMYLSSIQQGIQAAHVTADMFVGYQPFNTDEECDAPSEQFQLLTSWAKYHKTMILLNAGYASELESLVDFFTYGGHKFPWAYFRESQDAMQQCITCVGVILPEYIWEGARQLREGPKVSALVSMRENGYVEWEDKSQLVNLKPQLVKTDLSKWEFDLIVRLNNYGLAR